MSSVESTSAWAQTLSSISSALSTHLQDKMLKKMDTDSSGGVDQTEFKAALEKVAGKLGVDVGEGSEALYEALDADKDGALNGGEVGQLLKNLFAAPSDTQAFVQSRGDEARFAELDTDKDGNISMTEFGIAPVATGSVTTTTTTTTVVSTTELPTGLVELPAGMVTKPATGLETPVAALEEEPEKPIAGTTKPSTLPDGEDTTVAQAPTRDEGLQAMMKTVDKNGDGEISANELTQFVNLINAQAEAATKRYNETALASKGNTSALNATA